MDRRSGLRLGLGLGAGLGLSALGGGCARSGEPPAPGPSAADYRWFGRDNELTDGFSLVWVKGLSPREVTGRLGARSVRPSTWGRVLTGAEGEPGRAAYVVGVTPMPGWALVIDLGARLGVEEAALLPLSRGTTVLYHYLNAELDDLYQVVRDGVVRVSFEPYAPAFRLGRAPDEILVAMRRAGFVVGAASPGLGQPDPTGTAFALTELLTGIRLTMPSLRSRPYLLATVAA